MAYDVRRESSAFERTDLDQITASDGYCRYEIDTDERPSVAVVAVVDVLLGDDLARVEDELLYECVDPDALDTLLAAGFDGEISFTFRGCSVTIGGDRSLTVRTIADE